MIHFNVLTLFPEMFEGYCSSSICGRAIQAGLIGVELHNFRDFSKDKHRRVDDAPFGGGAGMVIMPQPVFDCLEHIERQSQGVSDLNIYLSPGGTVLNQKLSIQLAGFEQLNILCGHYEGIDQRIIDEKIDLEISIGDYVLTGGELAAMVLMDAVMRHVPGVLGNENSTSEESFSGGLLEYPQYTRPADFRGLTVPQVLLGGHHAHIEAWRQQQALERTVKHRPDLLGLMEKPEGGNF